MATVFERVRTIVEDKTGKKLEEITENSLFFKDNPDNPSSDWLESDSLEIIEIVMAVETEFSIEKVREIKITDDDQPDVKTVGLLVAWLKERGVTDDEQ